jgi:hypothetical protein
MDLEIGGITLPIATWIFLFVIQKVHFRTAATSIPRTSSKTAQVLGLNQNQVVVPKEKQINFCRQSRSIDDSEDFIQLWEAFSIDPIPPIVWDQIILASLRHDSSPPKRR